MDRLQTSVIEAQVVNPYPASPIISRRRTRARPKRRIYDDPLRPGLAFLIIITLSKFGSYFGILRQIRPALLLFCFCAVAAFLNPKTLVLTNLKRNLTVWLLLGILVAVIGSAAFGISLGRAATFINGNFSKTLAIAFLMMVAIRDTRDLRTLTWAFTLGTILLAFLSLFVVGISKSSINGVSYDANDVGVFMTMSLPLALLFFQSATNKKEKLVAILGIGLMAATLVKSQSRGAFIGTLVVCAALLMMPGIAVRRRLFFVAAASFTMVVAAPDGYWTAMRSILSDPKADYNWDAINGRRNLAKRGIRYMIDYPVFGVGIYNFPMAEGTISDKARNLVRGQGIRWAAPHNSFIQAGAETGFTGLFLWTSLVIANILVPLRLSRRLPRSWLKGTPNQRFLAFGTRYLPVAQLGFAATASFVSFAWLEPVYFFSALIVGLTVVVRRELAPPAAYRNIGFRSLRTRAIASPASPAFAPHHQIA